MLKKRFANGVNNGNIEYTQKRVDEEFFKGYVCLAKIKKVEKPLIVHDDNYTACIMDENYEWLEIYPDNKKYTLIAMLDENKNLIQWYFDMIKASGIENGIPYMFDLYLDLLITPQGEQMVLDENELKEALDQKIITKNDYDMAYETLKEVQSIYNLEHIKRVTQILYSKFKPDKINFGQY